jgi:hypothetical protein
MNTNHIGTTNLSKLRRILQDQATNSVTDALLKIQENFASLEEAYEIYLEDESNDDAQYKIQECIADLAISAQTILIILESENDDFAPSPSLDNAVASRLTTLLAQ